tara:strand:+ start:157 stop:387 length:231 start_codon:yes stop_codon:yes gene_type:complete
MELAQMALRQNSHRLSDASSHLSRLNNTRTMMVHLMDATSPAYNWRALLKSQIATHDIDICRMGFPLDWESRPLWH